MTTKLRFLAAALIATGCATTASKPAPAPATSQAPAPSPDTQQIAARAHEAVSQGALLLDVRTPEEFAEKHLPGAINIPLDQLESRLVDVGPMDKPVVVYCRTGRRSGQAAELLQKVGYTDVIQLGAMDNWYAGTTQ